MKKESQLNNLIFNITDFLLIRKLKEESGDPLMDIVNKTYSDLYKNISSTPGKTINIITFPKDTYAFLHGITSFFLKDEGIFINNKIERLVLIAEIAAGFNVKIINVF